MNLTPSKTILYVDDEKPNLDAFRRAFEEDFSVKTCLSAQEALDLLEKEHFSMVIADQRMPGMTGIELCERLYKTKPDIIRMILTAYTETPMLLDAIRRGHVQDYIVKPWKKSDLMPLLDQAFEDHFKRIQKIKELETRAAQVDLLKEELNEIQGEEGIIGVEGGLKKIMDVLKKAAPMDSTMLLLGETGTGKELLAHTIHQMSRRSDGPFVAVHCAALPKTLMESELFGHEKGSFTGADKQRIGRFEKAQGGTLFLDEVGEIPEDIQVKLLRVIQERQIERLGSSQSIPIDVRLVVATHRDLPQMVKEGRFREDLYYRLNVITIKIPPLRERREDLPTLASHILKKLVSRTGVLLDLSEKSSELLAQYDWPGNIRELENVLERASILCAGPVLEPDDLQLNVEDLNRVQTIDVSRLASTNTPVSVREKVHQEEQEKLKTILLQAKGNVAEASRIMGVARTTLIHRLKKYGLI